MLLPYLNCLQRASFKFILIKKECLHISISWGWSAAAETHVFTHAIGPYVIQFQISKENETDSNSLMFPLLDKSEYGAPCHPPAQRFAVPTTHFSLI